MDIQRGKITFLGAASIIFLSSGMIIHVLVLPIMLEIAGRDAWISILIAAPFYLLLLVLLKRLIAYLNGQSLVDWVKQKWGKLGYVLFTLAMVGILYFYSLHTLLDTTLWTISTYLQDTPILVVCGLLLLLCLMLAFQGLQSITVTAAILFPIISFLGFFVATSNNKYKDYSLLLPMLEHGLPPVLSGATYVFAALCDSLLFIFIAHEIKTEITFKKMMGMGLFLIMIFIGPITAGIAEFGIVESTAQRYSAFDQWKIISAGKFLQHVDFLSIFQWLSGSIIRISFSLYLLIKLLDIHTKKKTLSFVIAIVISMLIVIKINQGADFTLKILKDYYFPFFLIFVIFFSLAFFVTFLFSRSGSETPSNDQKQINGVGELDESNEPQSTK